MRIFCNYSGNSYDRSRILDVTYYSGHKIVCILSSLLVISPTEKSVYAVEGVLHLRLLQNVNYLRLSVVTNTEEDSKENILVPSGDRERIKTSLEVSSQDDWTFMSQIKL